MTKKLNKRFIGIGLALALVLAATAAFWAQSTTALPANEVTRTYYNNASHSVIVGERTLSCYGGTYGWGSVTAYKTVSSFPCN